jgi:hypothetical protein
VAAAVDALVNDDHRRVALGGGVLVLTRAFVATSTPDGGRWRARGRVVHGRARAWRDRVELDVSMWSAEIGEVCVRPLRRRIALSWTPRHSHSYYEVTHQLAAWLAETLTAGDEVTPARRPVQHAA